MMKIVVKESAKKDLKKLEKNIAKRVLIAIVELEAYPDVSNIKMLKNFTPAYRKRVGDYRILFEVEDQKITVYRIRHRKEAY